MSAFGTLETPVGVIGVESDGAAITRVTWRSTAPEGSVVSADPGADPLLVEALAQLRAYFDGALQRFDVPVDLGVQTTATRAVLLPCRRPSRTGRPSPTADSPPAAAPPFRRGASDRSWAPIPCR